jgi:hypothetical protein
MAGGCCVAHVSPVALIGSVLQRRISARIKKEGSSVLTSQNL